jgi:hypothetical protein
MKNLIFNLTAILSSLFFPGCSGTLHLLDRDSVGCLGYIAVKPYDIDVRDFLIPQEVDSILQKKNFGKPSVECMPVSSDSFDGLKITYKYENAIFYFMKSDFSTSLYRIEIIKGQVGCLKIGESKKEYISKYGPISNQNYDKKTFFIKQNEKDPIETKFGLYIEFKDNRVALIRPDFGEIFKIQEN